jgi:hypothetical protein
MAKVFIGVDPHKLSATIEVVDDDEMVLANDGMQTDREPHQRRVGSRDGEHPAEHLDRVWPDTGPTEIV